MSTSTSTSARRTATLGTRRTTGRPRSHALASAIVSATGTPVRPGRLSRGSWAASAATVSMPAARSATATSPRTTKLTSCVRVSSASQVGHHGQCLHSVIREGHASAGSPAAAAAATATRSVMRTPYSSKVERPPGQCSANRSCQTTTSAS